MTFRKKLYNFGETHQGPNKARIPCSWIRRLNILKILLFPKSMNLNQNPDITLLCRI